MAPPAEDFDIADFGGDDGWGDPGPKAKPKKKAGSWKSELKSIDSPSVPKTTLPAPTSESPKPVKEPTSRGPAEPSAAFAPKRGPSSSDGWGVTDSGDGGYGGGGSGEGGDDSCRICKQSGHFARECPDKPSGSGGCFNCGEDGHMKQDCPNPRKFTGECRNCGVAGHGIRDCPIAPSMKCRKCLKEGHTQKDCTEDRACDLSYVTRRTPEEAWALLEKANKEEDFDDFKTHMLEYMVSQPGTSFADLEKSFRDSKFNYYLYALEIELHFTKCIVHPLGGFGKYIWSLNKSAKPRRAKALVGRFADDPRENLKRLKQAGFLESYLGDYCRKCRSQDHSGTTCTLEPDFQGDDFMGGPMPEKVVLKCTNCESLSHRLRDCPEPRKTDHNRNVCRNCQEEGHRASECEKPRVAGPDTECRKCEGRGHFAADCPTAPKQSCFNCGQEGHRSSDCNNEKVPKCRNCDEFGHIGKECPKPRDVTRVRCNNCNEMGHWSKGCTNPASQTEATDDGWGAGSSGAPKASGGDGWGGSSSGVPKAKGDDGWGSSSSGAPKAGGGGAWGVPSSSAPKAGGGDAWGASPSSAPKAGGSGAWGASTPAASSGPLKRIGGWAKDKKGSAKKAISGDDAAWGAATPAEGGW